MVCPLADTETTLIAVLVWILAIVPLIWFLALTWVAIPVDINLLLIDVEYFSTCFAPERLPGVFQELGL